MKLFFNKITLGIPILFSVLFFFFNIVLDNSNSEYNLIKKTKAKEPEPLKHPCNDMRTSGAPDIQECSNCGVYRFGYAVTDDYCP